MWRLIFIAIIIIHQAMLLIKNYVNTRRSPRMSCRNVNELTNDYFIICISLVDEVIVNIIISINCTLYVTATHIHYSV